ncbi:MAG: hypothetical protein H7A46_14240 [Verrucomicrobiales bacterium]|nr:hypothetical protein [Verrucomicrobiales bacterium]
MSGEPAPRSEIVLYQTEDGRTRVECRFEEGTIWLPQRQIAGLFQVTVPTVNEHLKGIYEDGELEREATIRRFRIVQMEGNRQVGRLVEHYRLEAILKWCRLATDHASTCGGKPWTYALIPHDAIAENITLDWLVRQFARDGCQ